MTSHLIFTIYATTLIKNPFVNHGDHACFALGSPGFKHGALEISSLWFYEAFFSPSRQIHHKCITPTMPQALNYDLQASDLNSTTTSTNCFPLATQSNRHIHKISLPYEPCVHAYSWDLLLQNQTLPLVPVFPVSSENLQHDPCVSSHHPYYRTDKWPYSNVQKSLTTHIPAVTVYNKGLWPSVCLSIHPSVCLSVMRQQAGTSVSEKSAAYSPLLWK